MVWKARSLQGLSGARTPASYAGAESRCGVYPVRKASTAITSLLSTMDIKRLESRSNVVAIRQVKGHASQSLE